MSVAPSVAHCLFICTLFHVGVNIVCLQRLLLSLCIQNLGTELHLGVNSVRLKRLLLFFRAGKTQPTVFFWLYFFCAK